MRLLFLILCVSFLCSCSGQPKSCTKFKTGTFIYNHPDYKGHIIKRNDSLQIEYNDKDAIKIISYVKWVSDCEFILTYKDIENYSKKESVIGREISVKILETSDDSYTCHVTSDIIDEVLKFSKVED